MNAQNRLSVLDVKGSVQDKDSPICTNKATVFPRGQSVFGEGEVIVQEERLSSRFQTRRALSNQNK